MTTTTRPPPTEAGVWLIRPKQTRPAHKRSPLANEEMNHTPATCGCRDPELTNVPHEEMNPRRDEPPTRFGSVCLVILRLSGTHDPTQANTRRTATDTPNETLRRSSDLNRDPRNKTPAQVMTSPPVQNQVHDQGAKEYHTPAWLGCGTFRIQMKTHGRPPPER
ncbi:hypothetical protein BS47DRAFT_1368023 [Hydnum rufescens UP504]|uniref:Uncharacterized protein n=1 Tax=Hydnum rufescens UP504 TaxID=1448309 RepID=A0A9P6DL14_9AGAM|nr:hypothetical protein BS47DRAFT_1368023 [Hydnum rufescens UP504]